MNKPIIRVVCATRLSQDGFMNSATGRSLMVARETSNVQLRLTINNSDGLSDVYNKAIEESLNEDISLVFIHDDVWICDYYWAERVQRGLKEFDVIGVVGNTRRQESQPGWILADLDGKLDDQTFLSGAIGQGRSFPPDRLDYFGPHGLECKLMDGVFLAVSSKTLNNTNLRFDGSFKFHFYDLDFCRSAEFLGLRMGTIPLSLIHESYGNIASEWHTAYKQYLDKWGS